jgi:hypothetical protein
MHISSLRALGEGQNGVEQARLLRESDVSDEDELASLVPQSHIN